jgi:HEXXH motif-containing protein
MYRLPQATFDALAAGGGDLAAVRFLHEAQQSKHTMLLHAVASTSADTAAFLADHDLIARLQASSPDAVTWLFGLPQFGGWVYDSLTRLDQGFKPDVGYLACLTAAVAVRAGAAVAIEVPVRAGRLVLPGLGWLSLESDPGWIRLVCDGEKVTAGRLAMARRTLVPDDGSGPAGPWQGTPVIRAAADGLTWDVQLETGDVYLDRYTLPMSADLPELEIDRWRRRIQSAWAVLVRQHRVAAESIAAGVPVIVPLRTQLESDLVSATTPAAFGAVATSWPPDPVTLAETLVHEFQHVKLGALMDMVRLTEPGGPKVYAPWRRDPRPAAGLLQGVYAHLGIARFWAAERNAEIEPDALLRAQAQFARWQPTIDVATRTLIDTDCLTPAGLRFAHRLRAAGQRLESERVPGPAREIADEVALDHKLTWQLQHLAFDPTEIGQFAKAYEHGDPRPPATQLASVIRENTREVGSTVRSRLLSLRYLAPARYRELCANGRLQLSQADVMLFTGEPDAAIRLYRDQIRDSAVPRPEAWIGLALAVHRLPQAPLREPFATSLPVMFDVHSRLSEACDPIDLAGWFM